MTILIGDARDRLAELEPGSVQTCVTSPPYFGLRDYDVAGQIGLEPTPNEYVAALVDTFREVSRVLRDDGTLWLNLGDSYNTYAGNRTSHGALSGAHKGHPERPRGYGRAVDGLKAKDLLGMPWTVAFALRAAGWYLRSDVIWSKPNPMPESVGDRPTKAHEYLFLFSKQARYFYDADAIREPHQWADDPRNDGERHEYAEGAKHYDADVDGRQRTRPGAVVFHPKGRNKRSVWEVSTQGFAGAHFAVFPPKLIEPCILAGTHPGDTVLDPFAGSGTTGVVAAWHRREFVGVELNPEYAELARRRIATDGRLGRPARRGPAVPDAQDTLFVHDQGDPDT